MYIYISKIINGKGRLPNKGHGISYLFHMITEFKKLRIPSDPSGEFDGAIDTLDNETRLIRNAWAHNGGKYIDNGILDGIEGIEKHYSQISISKEYTDKVIRYMNVVSLELNDTVRKIAIEEHKRKQADE